MPTLIRTSAKIAVPPPVAAKSEGGGALRDWAFGRVGRAGGVRAPAFTKAFEHSPAFEEQRPLAESCSADRRRNVDGRCFCGL